MSSRKRHEKRKSFKFGFLATIFLFYPLNSICFQKIIQYVLLLKMTNLNALRKLQALQAQSLVPQEKRSEPKLSSTNYSVSDNCAVIRYTVHDSDLAFCSIALTTNSCLINMSYDYVFWLQYH